MLDIESARAAICAAVNTIDNHEKMALGASLGRILADDIVSTIAVPPADNSAMDGYAVNTQDTDTPQTPLKVSQRIPAGMAPPPLSPGTAARIFTGANIPANANAVVIQENCEAQGDHVLIGSAPLPQQNIRPKGQDIQVGQTIAKRGEKITPALIGLIASIGEQYVNVFQKIRIAVVSTGDELVPIGQPLAPGQIYNSNQAMLSALLAQLNCEVIPTAIVHDSLEACSAALTQCAHEAHIVISTGGVSVGEEDHIKNAVSQLGQLHLWKVNIKPGKPLAFGHINGTPFLGLPGNPVSAYVTFALFAIPLIHKRQGRLSTSPHSYYLPANFERKKAQSRTELMRVNIDNQQVNAFTNQSSGVLTSVCWANALARIPENTTVDRGDLIEVIPLESFLY